MQILRDASVRSHTSVKGVFFAAYRSKGVSDPETTADKAWRTYCSLGQEHAPDTVIDYCLDILTNRKEVIQVS